MLDSVREHITISNPTKGEPRKLKAPLTEITPLTDFNHLERHWGGQELGSEFTQNDFFKDSKELTTLLQEIGSELIDPNEFDRFHRFTISFDKPIGKIGITEIKPGEEAFKTVRDSGKDSEADIQVVPRHNKPETNLLTFEFKPVKMEGSDGAIIRFQLSSAFPGEQTNPLVSKTRVARHSISPDKDKNYQADKDYWQNHAFIHESEIPGLWKKDHGLTLPKLEEAQAKNETTVGFQQQELLIVADADGNIIAVIDTNKLHPDEEMPSYDAELIKHDIYTHMSEFGLANCNIKELRISNKNYAELKLDSVEAYDLTSLTGRKDWDEYEMRLGAF